MYDGTRNFLQRGGGGEASGRRRRRRRGSARLRLRARAKAGANLTVPRDGLRLWRCPASAKRANVTGGHAADLSYESRPRRRHRPRRIQKLIQEHLSGTRVALLDAHHQPIVAEVAATRARQGIGRERRGGTRRRVHRSRHLRACRHAAGMNGCSDAHDGPRTGFRLLAETGHVECWGGRQGGRGLSDVYAHSGCVAARWLCVL